jgi:mono/diheme cytochrome c family protein
MEVLLFAARRIALTLLVLIALGASLALIAAAPAKSPSSSHDAKVKRGEYLTRIMGCNDCHTPGVMFGAADFSRQLSGSELGWQGPWGVTYARNITPDLETGIGKWTEAEIVKTLRTGQRPDGSVLLPPMPYQDFAILTDADAYAIAAYLKSIPPVQHKSLDRVPPGQTATGSICVFPPPGAWDAPRTPPAAAGGEKK